MVSRKKSSAESGNFLDFPSTNTTEIVVPGTNQVEKDIRVHLIVYPNEKQGSRESTIWLLAEFV
jgi:hypothetical protein